MSELTIRRDNMTFTPPTFKGTAKADQTSGAASAEKAAESKPADGKTVNISDTLKDLMNRIGQAEGQLRESRGFLQLGQAVLDEVKETLDRIGELTKEAVEGEEPDREAIQKELDQLTAKIDRMLNGASMGDKPLFAEGKVDFIEGILSGEIDLDEVLDAVRQVIQELAEGMPPEQALGTLDLGSPLLTLLTGMGGMNLDLLMGVLTALQSAQTAPEGARTQSAAETAQTAETADLSASAPGTIQVGNLQITGTDLSGVTFDETTGQVTIAGEADVTVQGTGQGEQAAIRLTGSGEVTLQDVKAEVLTVDAPQARIVSAGENQLGELRMEPNATLTVEGNGLTRLNALRGDGSNLLQLNEGVLVVTEEKGRSSKGAEVPIAAASAALLLAQTASVRAPEGKAMEPFDLMWKALLPSLSLLTELEVDGKQMKQSQLNSGHARLWLAKGDEDGYTVHTVVIQGKDKNGEVHTRYAYLRWDQRAGEFREVEMYPNPFTVTGGEAGEDWVYEEETQTLRILTRRVTAISGGIGTDAEEEPFSGRVALADHIALIELTLEGVECRVAAGKAFDLGRDNEVFLTLASGTRNVFESGDGSWGISLGEDSHVNIGYAQGPVGILAATIGSHFVPEPEPEPEREGIPLRMGNDTVTLPQFPLSAKGLHLDMLRVSNREYAQAAMTIVDADRRWVSQIQAVYRGLYGQLSRSTGGSSGGRQASAPAALVRDSAAAGSLMEDVKRTILLHPETASYLHSRRGRSELQRLVK